MLREDTKRQPSKWTVLNRSTPAAADIRSHIFRRTAEIAIFVVPGLRPMRPLKDVSCPQGDVNRMETLASPLRRVQPIFVLDGGFVLANL